MPAKAKRITKVCVACGESFEVRFSQEKRHKSCGKPECVKKAYSLANQNRPTELRQRIGETRKQRFASGKIKTRLSEFRLSSSNALTEAESFIAPFLSQLNFIPHHQINTGLSPRYGNSHMFVVDFANIEQKMYIEIDGRSHHTLKGQERDVKRGSLLLELGWQGIHITNDNVFHNFESARNKVLEFITQK